MAPVTVWVLVFYLAEGPTAPSIPLIGYSTGEECERAGEKELKRNKRNGLTVPLLYSCHDVTLLFGS